MNKQRKVLITTTYNEMGIIIDTKAEEVTQPNLQPTCNQLATDCISRQAAIDAFEDTTFTKNEILRRLSELPSAQPERTDCTDCEEYDNETHSCPKYCEVIRQTLAEAKPERMGRWIQHEDSEDMFLAFLTPYHCSECGAVCRDIHDKWCYGCGAKMEGE